MSKVKKINLDTKELTSLIQSLRTFSNDLKKLPKDITKEVADIGQEFLENEYATTRTDQTIDINSISTDVIETSNGYSIVASGKDLLYAEFGTGEYGAEDPHPRKSEFGLNAYNSGPTIKVNTKTGRHYWWYQGYSEGNASGKQMFNTGKFLKDNVINKVMKEKVGEVISKV